MAEEIRPNALCVTEEQESRIPLMISNIKWLRSTREQEYIEIKQWIGQDVIV